MRPAAITAGVISLIWLIARKSTDTCCPHCDWEVEDDE